MENHKIKPTKKSIDLANDIIKKMDGETFHNHYHLLYDIASSFKGKNLNYLEIGTYCGASASLMSTHKKVSKICCVDVGHPISPLVAEKNLYTFRRAGCDFRYVQANSSALSCVNTVGAYMPSVDILFIDGDHTKKGVQADFTNYSPLVKKGGYVVFDDYQDEKNSPEVKEAVDELLKVVNVHSKFHVIGTLAYPELELTTIKKLKNSNLFILKKV